jgi:hypothetical protein
MTAAAGTLLFLLIIVGLVAVAAIAVVVVLLGVLAGVSTALAAFIEWRQQRRPERAEPHRRGSLRDWMSRVPPLRWATAKVAEVEGRDGPRVEQQPPL